MMMYGKDYGKMSAEDKTSQAHEDCRTLIEYYEIMDNKPRYKAAMKAAEEKKKALEMVTMNPGEMSMGAYSKMRKKQESKKNKGMDY